MRKNGLNRLKTFLLISAGISAWIIVGILTGPSQDKFESILGLSSVMVTLILGVLTFYQTNEQTQIDMLDKIPYFRFIRDTEYENHSFAGNIDSNALYTYNKFLRYGNHSDGIGAVVSLQFENISGCIIKKVTKYICEDKKYSEGGKFTKYGETQLVKLCSDPAENAYMYRNGFNLNEREFDLITNEGFDLAIRFSPELVHPASGKDQQSFDFSIALEIETVHGYVYTQYMVFTVVPVPVFAGADWVMITDYDVDITSDRIEKKYLR